MSDLQILTNETKAYFDAQAAIWDEYSKPDYAKIRSIMQTINMQYNKRILDVACGTGVLFPCLMEYTPQTLRGIDLSTQMVSIAQQNHRHPSISVSEDNFYSFAESGFDYVFIYNAYPHFLDKELFAQKVYECLAPGGRFVIAHGNGRDRINNVHSKPQTQLVSKPLRSCIEERKILSRFFNCDIMVDTAQLYVLSGQSLPQSA